MGFMCKHFIFLHAELLSFLMKPRFTANLSNLCHALVLVWWHKLYVCCLLMASLIQKSDEVYSNNCKNTMIVLKI